MNTSKKIIDDSYITTKTALPLFTERYSFVSHKMEELHFHDFYEIGIILSGSLKHHTQTGSEYLKEGCVYFIPMGFSHSLESDIGFTIQNLYLLPRLLFQNISQNSILSLPPLLHDFLLFCTNSSKDGFTLSLSRDQFTLLRHLLDTFTSARLTASLQDSFSYHSLLNLLLILCDSFQCANPYTLVRKDERIYQILRMIQENLFLPTGEIIGTAADTLSLHPQYLNKLIKKELHTTFSGLILDTKIEKSCELLLQNIPITDVASLLAFYDHSHFNKFFLRSLGISPSVYQERNRLHTRP